MYKIIVPGIQKAFLEHCVSFSVLHTAQSWRVHHKGLHGLFCPFPELAIQPIH